MKTITCEQGIGDNLWLLMTLDPTQTYDFDVITQGNQPARAHQLFELVDMAGRVQYIKAGRDRVTHPINNHLEAGNRIEEFNGVCNWDIQLNTSEYFQAAKKAMGELLTAKGNKRKGKTYIGVYASATKNVNGRTQAWDKQRWKAHIAFLREHYDAYIIGIGAEYDDMLDGIELDAYIKGELFGTVIEVLRKIDLCISFQSGIGILANYLNVPTIMYFFPHLAKMHNTFNKPGIAWKGCTFPRKVEQINAWITANPDFIK